PDRPERETIYPQAAPEITVRASTITSSIARVKIKTLISRRRFPDVLTDGVEDFSGSTDVTKDTGDCFPDLTQIRRLQLQETQGGTSVFASARDRLLDFVRQRGRQFSHRAHAVHVGEIRLQLTEDLLRPLARGQIENKGDALVAVFFEQRTAKKHGNA